MRARVAATFLLAVAVLSGCTAGTSTPAGPVVSSTTTLPAPAEPDLYVMLMWHHHQPFYPLDDDGVVTRPWVRVHATKDYVDMATTVAAHPDVSVTFNLTPVLLTQIQMFLDGTRDVYWTTTEVPADQLTDAQRGFLMRRFFDVNQRIVDRFPRYAELARARAAAGGPDAPLDTFTVEDYRDLQVLFNLAWTDPDFLGEDPLADLVSRGRSFTEADKAVVLGEHERIVGMVFDVHRQLWDSGQIEVTTTPFAHPILPLVIDTDVATVGDPGALMPERRFSEPLDAVEQVERGLDLVEDLLGRRPVGMWPAEGAVSRLAVSVMARAGVEWIATGEAVLAAGSGLGESFPRGSGDVPDAAELLYRPHAVPLQRGDDVPIFFRDVRLSDLIGFEYSGSSGEAAAADFFQRLEAIRDRLGPAPDGSPWVVSVILDGENAWEHYPNDGKDFLDALYRGLATTDWLGTITPSAYLERHGSPPPLDHDVFPGSWFQASFATWIGEPEEAAAWDYLARARADLHEAAPTADPDAFADATEAMLFAQGSDWFWWYGDDQSSGDDAYFDGAFRAWIGRMYEALGLEVPSFVGIPIIPSLPVAPTVEPSGEAVSPSLDGTVGEDEWAGATVYDLGDLVLRAGLDAAQLTLAVTGAEGGFELALGVPSASPWTGLTDDGQEFGFGLTHEVSVGAPGGEACLVVGEDRVCDLSAVAGPDGWEVAIPTARLGTIEPGDRIAIRVVRPGGLLPAAGPGVVQVPDVSSVDVRVDLGDPLGDDTGPGSYTYPTDAVFLPGSFDLTRFTAGVDGNDVVFTVEVAAPIRNPWGSPNGLAIQTFDIYIDVDPGAATGARLLIPGRNAALGPDDGWEVALTVEGWDSALYRASTDGSTEETKPTIGIVTLAEKGKVIVRVPAELLPAGDPADWGFTVAVLGQEGFPSSGVRRVRDVQPAPAQWRFGGAPAGTVNHTRIIDLLLPGDGGVQGGPGDQARLLSDLPVWSGSPADLGPDDVARVPVVTGGVP